MQHLKDTFTEFRKEEENPEEMADDALHLPEIPSMISTQGYMNLNGTESSHVRISDILNSQARTAKILMSYNENVESNTSLMKLKPCPVNSGITSTDQMEMGLPKLVRHAHQRAIRRTQYREFDDIKAKREAMKYEPSF